MKTLITGGAGYIGSHTVRLLLEKNHEVIVIDSLEKGFRDSLPKEIDFHHAKLSDENVLDNIFTNDKIDAVMHFADYIEVGESEKFPEKYFQNNVTEGLILLHKMMKYKVNKIIHSSSAAVYDSSDDALTENYPKKPNSVYGLCKLLFEDALKRFEKSFGLKHISLRYFNAAGAAYEIGESHRPETHLIPLVLQVALNQKDKIQIFGDDYPTQDGTCIRDYIHVLDLAQVHLLALESLGKKTGAYNVGLGHGYSVKEIIKICKKVTGHPIQHEIISKRQGDPASLVASSEKIKHELNWKPRFTNIEDIIKSAWQWHKNNPNGFKN